VKLTIRTASVAFVAVLLTPLMAAVAGSTREEMQAAPQDTLPAGPGKDVLLKTCTGCHQVSTITSQHKTEAKWADTVVEMKSRGASGSDEEMAQIVHYLSVNFGPEAGAKVNVNSAAASDIVAGLSLSQENADAIVAYRTKNGKFKDIDGLKQVPGVEAAKVDAAKDKIEF
jgi:competence protein ComEA